ncbi:putative membrane protein, putative [Trypanosoma equiperdum]|uniref:Uncharacterized protein n=2 Tax=Trypanozoon TaxID=39700 RepID=Q389Y2_TRYB2|nr:hypothetical protein, conserved [Trypanosoma brucei brucei TREU927]EAN78388.1 hypothetical protein, conserved [Trypanosoma brucei brucei TREU927]SCU68004.1 Predicted membrane protein, putative [Trypanosoma equiperdum]
MRVLTHHRHAVNRGSATLGGLTMVNTAYSFLFAFPVAVVSLVVRWHKKLTLNQRALCVTCLVVWTLVDVLRLHLGYSGNRKQYVPSLIGFFVMTLLPQLPLAIAYNLAWPHLSSLDYATSTVMIMLLVAEIVFSLRVIVRLIRNNRIDYYVYGPYHVRDLY